MSAEKDIALVVTENGWEAWVDADGLNVEPPTVDGEWVSFEWDDVELTVCGGVYTAHVTDDLPSSVTVPWSILRFMLEHGP